MGDQEDLPKEDGKGYIAYLGEMRLFQMGLLEASEVRKNPLMWMEWLVAGSAHDNFFEKRVSAYSHGKLEGECDMSRHYNKLPKEVLDKLKN
jgi:ribonucleotide reductase beta subunit family protein with ferritin-like domain